MSDQFENAQIKLAKIQNQGGPLVEAHVHCANHRLEIERSKVAGCFYCCTTFSPSRIEDWIDDDEGTAMCPNCGIDSVIGDASGFPITDSNFLKQMNKIWL